MTFASWRQTACFGERPRVQAAAPAEPHIAVSQPEARIAEARVAAGAGQRAPLRVAPKRETRRQITIDFERLHERGFALPVDQSALAEELRALELLVSARETELVRRVTPREQLPLEGGRT